MIFMAKGVGVLEVLVAHFIKNREHINERAKTFARLFRNNIVEGTVRYFDETHPSLPGASLVVDCTVCETTKPAGSFEASKFFFSGKHWFYAIKKEVCVNIRSGTAALISKAYEGSKHDVAILREHADVINNTLQGRSILGDKGYRGAERDIPTFIVCGEDAALQGRRVLVECFFGRLKSLWSIFEHAWTMEKADFDIFFDIACGLTNVHVLLNPLREVDSEFNQGILNFIKREVLQRKEQQRRANEAYRRRRQARLQYQGSDIHTML